MTQEQMEKRKKLICDLMNDSLYVPMKLKELAIFLQVSKQDRGELEEVLNELLNEEKIQITQTGKYMKAYAKKSGKKGKESALETESKSKEKKSFAKSSDTDEYLTGTFISNQRGFGFVEVEGREQDLFIPEDCVNGAFHNDIVQVKLLSHPTGKRQEAVIVKILEHAMKHVVGTFEKSKNFGFVIPDNSKIGADIFVPVERSKGAMDGHKVVVEITDYGNHKKSPEGKVVEILGHINDPGVDILSIVRAFDIPCEFGEKVMNQAERVPEEIIEADMNGRKDLRDVMMVTIDGEDAKDLDDAVSVSKEGDLYCLGVHIADVSNYVQENSALDREAYKRGTSVYLVDRVIPMLPHRLSNGICSLNAGVDRLALSCIMKIDAKGNVVDYELAETVIRVNRRMSYTAVAAILEDKDEALIKEYEELVPMFEMMAELSDILRKKRHKRGSIDFDFPESKIILDKNGHPIDIKPYDRNRATKIIEDFMLAANETVAQHFYWQELPFVYRTHESPDPEKIQKLSTFIYNFGYSIHVSGEEVHPKEVQKLINKIEGTPEEALISRLALRSMKQAKYSTECTGHFGLACNYYCHFTSPIRRYPDLQIHRIIKEQLRRRLNDNRIEHYNAILFDVAGHTSKTERRADEAERETEKLKKAEYMADHIGECFEGVVSGVTAWGMYVELPNTIEGMVHISKLPDDYFIYDESSYELRGTSTSKKYKLGEKVWIRVEGIDRLTRTIDFSIVKPEEESDDGKGSDEIGCE